MNDLKTLGARYYRTGFLVLCGLIVIIFGALGFVYFQQIMTQEDLTGKIGQLSIILARPMAPIDPLQEQYDAVAANLSRIDNNQAIERLIEIAEKYEIDTSQETGKFIVPPAAITTEKVGETIYRVLSYKAVSIQGRFEEVIAFLNDIDSGLTYTNIVMNNISFTQVVSPPTGEEAERRQELQVVQDAVLALMNDNGLYFIPNPFNAAGGTATNNMGDNTESGDIFEGFPAPDITAYEKGYLGDPATIKQGYLLWQHDKVNMDTRTTYTTVDYINIPFTDYYYTCESNGKVRQWDDPVISLAREYDETSPNIIELRLILDIKFYTMNK